MTTNYKDITRLVPIFGKWDLSAPERPLYEGPQPGFDTPVGICVSDVHFVEGEARVTVKFPTFERARNPHGRLLIGYRSPEAPYLSVGIGGDRFAYQLYQFERATGWRSLMLAGNAGHIISGKPYDISVHVQGQRLFSRKTISRSLSICSNHPLRSDNLVYLPRVLTQGILQTSVCKRSAGLRYHMWGCTTR
jgi:hypothetical protein